MHDLDDLSDRLHKVKTEQDRQDDNERSEAGAGISWDAQSHQYRIRSRTDEENSDQTVVDLAGHAEKQDGEPIYIEFDEGGQSALAVYHSIGFDLILLMFRPREPLQLAQGEEMESYVHVRSNSWAEGSS